MEATRGKRRSFSKSKLIRSFYRAATTPPGAVQQPYSSKPPKPSTANLSPASVEFAANQTIKPKAPPSSATASSPMGFIIVNQDQVYTQQTPKVAFVVADSKRDSCNKLEHFYGGGGGAAAEDEGVDDRASKYISSVQERFRLERVNSERKNFEDICL